MTEQLTGFALALLAGYAGYRLFRLFRFPAAAIIGSMAATGFVNVMGWLPHFNGGPLSYVCSVGIGLVLGKQLNRNVFCHARGMVRPVLVQIGCLLLLSLACGYIFYLLAGKDEVSLATALVSASAGGLTEMMVFGLSIGGDVAVIAFVQTFRLVTFLSLIPYSSKLARRLGDKRGPAAVSAACNFSGPFTRPNYLLLLLAAFGGGWVGQALGLPAGALLGSMFFAGGVGILLNKQYDYPAWVRSLAQVGLGMVMGQRVDAEVLSRLAGFFLPVLGLTAVMLIGCLLLALLQYKTTRYDLATCLMCSAPAGLSQVAVYAEETGTDVFTVAVFHTARMVSIVIIYPWIIVHLL